MYLYSSMLSADFTSESKLQIDFGLASTGDLVMMAFHDESGTLFMVRTISLRMS